MKTKTIKLIALIALVLTPVAIFAQDSAPDAAGAATETAAGFSAGIIDIALKVAAWYGVVCAGFNGLVMLIAAVVKKTPGTSDDEAVDKFYASGLYKTVAWVFSWGDYIGEFVTKLKK